MIKIGVPKKEVIGNKTILKSHIVDEVQLIEEDLYYMTENEYGDYLTDEVCDCFLIGLLQPALRNGQSIEIEGSLSERLAYNLPTIKNIMSLGCCKNDDISRTEIYYQTSYKWDGKTKSKAVGCGCSMGVDSLAAIKEHLSNDCPSSHRITHLTFFNVGAMGYVNLEKAKKSHEKDLQLVRKFAEEVNLPIVTIESNISLWHSGFDFDDSGHFRNMSAILSMQKLFRYYLYASSFHIKTFHFDEKYMGYYESLLFPLLSTENTEIVIANPCMTRVDKTKYILDDPLAQKFLYVCWKELIANRWPDSQVAKIKDMYLNCSRCDKCKRTLLAIDLMGKLDDFETIFDIPYWKSTRDEYIAKVILLKEKNTFYEELVELMKEVGYRPNRNVQKIIREAKLKKTIPYRAVTKIMRLIKL